MNNYDLWEEQARDEFESSEYYDDDMRDEYEITEDGGAYLNNFHVIRDAVTPYDEYKDYIKAV